MFTKNEGCPIFSKRKRRNLFFERKEKTPEASWLDTTPIFWKSWKSQKWWNVEFLMFGRVNPAQDVSIWVHLVVWSILDFPKLCYFPSKSNKNKFQLNFVFLSGFCGFWIPLNPISGPFGAIVAYRNSKKYKRHTCKPRNLRRRARTKSLVLVCFKSSVGPKRASNRDPLNNGK